MKFRSTSFSTVCNASIIGNLICDDDTNIPECGYDLGDCCYTNSKKSSCSACICHLWITSTFAPCMYRCLRIYLHNYIQCKGANYWKSWDFCFQRLSHKNAIKPTFSEKVPLSAVPIFPCRPNVQGKATPLVVGNEGKLKLILLPMTSTLFISLRVGLNPPIAKLHLEIDHFTVSQSLLLQNIAILEGAVGAEAMEG